MKSVARLRAWRAFMLLCAFGCFGSAELQAGTVLSPGPAVLIRKSVEPFGLFAFAISDGGLRQKWLRLLDDEMDQLALCDADRDGCPSPAALKLLAIVDAARTREGRARLGETNRAVNLAIRPMSDLAQHGEDDVWNSPLATLERGAGDCEDYAIAKLVALRLAGVPADDLRIVVMRDALAGEEHAVTAARLDGHWLVLDNRRMAMIEDDYVRNYQPLFVIYQSAVMKYADTFPSRARQQDDAARAVASTEIGRQDSLISATD
ncbi:MAG: transglutaminase-like cysteine peptidase [Bradyrhizobium sp.]|uniref:transglutaminase-like cysteine peptidase n=1 Tax=Bradyrhizobium sp. TaxID=376 RepID=UPI0025C476E4|nr:transglutaminase-like cysteine peptidase [Bradyrhizobium sp.]MBI5261427.1 transglutaminase-like cysteine peptidase [Bradyrhizobium sp.]